VLAQAGDIAQTGTGMFRRQNPEFETSRIIRQNLHATGRVRTIRLAHGICDFLFRHSKLRRADADVRLHRRCGDRRISRFRRERSDAERLHLETFRRIHFEE